MAKPNAVKYPTKGPNQKRQKGDKTLWFCDKRIGTCYKVSATPYSAVDKKTVDPHGMKYWVKPHMAETVDVFELGRLLASSRERAYGQLILSLNDDIETASKKIMRAASETM